MGMQDTLMPYETMCQLTNLMADAARENDWDQLSSLERKVAAIRNDLQAEYARGIIAELNESQRERKRELILCMLANDREIRRHTEPWMASVRGLLAGSVTERAVRKAYGGH